MKLKLQRSKQDKKLSLAGELAEMGMSDLFVRHTWQGQAVWNG